MTSGAVAMNILMGVYMQEYTDATPREIGALLMSMPFVALFSKPIICSKADRELAHRKYLLFCLLGVTISYMPFIIIPYIGGDYWDNKDNLRLNWNILVGLKVMGDMAFVSGWTLGDSLAINYAARTGTEFCSYRVWGTIAWMVFGLTIGLLNESPYFPKYVPGFLVLVLSCLLNMIVVWIWPDEYFRMVLLSKAEKDKIVAERSQGKIIELMSKESLYRSMRERISLLFGLRCCCKPNSFDLEKMATDKGKSMDTQIGEYKIESKQVVVKTEHVQSQLELQPQQESQPEYSDQMVGKKIQAQILWVIATRDLRFITYLLNFVFLGLSQIGLSFFFLSLVDVCSGGVCQFSLLAGFAQVTMAIAETLLFIYIKPVKAFLNYPEMSGIAFFVSAVKWLYYGTIWRYMDPHFLIIAESLHGLAYGFFLTLVVEVSHMFACEVEEILPTLKAKKIVDDNIDPERLKSSVSATMQAIMSTATDGIGRGVGAFLCGILVEAYSFETLWVLIGIKASLACLTAVAISFYVRISEKKIHPQDSKSKEDKQYIN